MLRNPFACAGLGLTACLFALNLAPERTLIVFLAATVCFAACLLVRNLPRRGGALVLCLSVMAAAVLFAAAQKTVWEPALALDRRVGSWSGTATGEAFAGENGCFSVLRTDGGQRVAIVSGDDYDLRPGDRVSFSGKLYAEQAWLGRADRVFLTCWYPQNVVIQRAERNLIRNWPFYARRFLNERVTRLVGGEPGTAAAAMVTGMKDGLSDDTYFAFRKAGVVHIVAVSGLHKNLLVLALYRLLRWLFVTKRRLCAAAGVAAAWAYAAVAAFTPSAVRACIVITAFLGGVPANRRISPLNSLGLAAFLILSANPYAVCSMSFELSFAATLGLLLISRNLLDMSPFEGVRRRLPRRILTAVYSTLVVTFGASVGCLPVYLFLGVDATVACFVSNLGAFFAVSPALLTGLFTALPGALGRLSAKLCRLCTGYILFIVRQVSRRDWFPLFSVPSAVLFLAVAAVWLIWRFRKKKK